MHLKVEHCQTLCVVNTFTFLTGKSIIVEGGQNDGQNQPKMPVCTVGLTVKHSQLTDFDHYSYLSQKFSYSRSVNT